MLFWVVTEMNWNVVCLHSNVTSQSIIPNCHTCTLFIHNLVFTLTLSQICQISQEL